MNKTAKRVTIFIAVIAVITAVCVLLSMREVPNFREKYAGTDLTTDITGMERVGAYTGYLDEHQEAKAAESTVEIELFSYKVDEGEASVCTDYEGATKALLTESNSLVTWEVDIPEAGFYNLYMEYLIPESRGVAAERAVYINGEIPFEDARSIAFSRIWEDGGVVRVDNQGNEIRPMQVEVYDWQASYFRDDMGYVVEP